MRARAAATHGVPAAAVSPTQIAEAFLDHACERKNTLRQAFAGFFTSHLGLPTGHSLLHGV
ncbi:MAG: hypothetical protein L0Y54_22325 [Sporichthyaceae bacterium]|nr:hypothetical protein [Sporichthyaceae bacterium]